MNFQQVALTVLAFSSARGGTISHKTAQSITIDPPSTISSRLIVEQDNQNTDSWYVRVVRTGRRTLQPPIYFPAATTQEALQDSLAKAWELHRQNPPSPPPRFHLSRFLESPSSSPATGSRDDSPGRGAFQGRDLLRRRSRSVPRDA